MIADWLLAAVFCAFLTVAGWPWVPILAGRRPPPLARAGLGYLIGAALVTIGLLLVAFLDLPIDRLALVAVVACWFLFGVGVRYSFRIRSTATPLVEGDGRPAVPVLAVAFIGFGQIVASTFGSGPIDSVDFLAFWGKKGLALFVDHDLTFQAIHDKAHNYYPLEISNIYGGMDLLLGHVNNEVIRLPLAAFAVSLMASTWWLCRLVMPPLPAALAVALPIATHQFSSSTGSGLADAPLAAYVTVCTLACFMWVRDDDPRWAALAGVAAGAAAWTKVEGTLTCAILLLTVVAIRRRRSFETYIAFGSFAFFVLPWLVFRKIHHIPDAPNQFSETNFHIVWIVTHVWDKLLLPTGVWGLFWWTCIMVVALAVPFWWQTEWRYLAALTLPNLVLTMGAYVITYSTTDRAIEITVHRLYLHLAPSVAVMTSGAVFAASAVLRAPSTPPNSRHSHEGRR